MNYAVKEIFYTLQSEGRHAGRAAVFCRFAGCNLWSGRGEDRASAACNFCDTDFVGLDGLNGGRYATSALLAERIAATWQGTTARQRLVVLTGGEPLLQVDTPLIEALHFEGFEIAVETNGTVPAPQGLDWICVSPKGANHLRIEHGNELKLVHPQAGVDPEYFEAMAFDHFLLQPMDGPQFAENAAVSVAYCLAHPRWQLSLQTHKVLGIP